MAMIRTKKYSSVLFTILAGCVLLTAVSCKPTDDQITKTVTNVARTVAPQINVNVQNGAVTLSGIIPDSLTKLDLDTAIRKMKGVVALHDQTSIPSLPDSVISHDKTITDAIDSAFRENHLSGITVSVYNGVVTLTGSTTAADFKTIQRIVDNVHPKKVLNGLSIK
jgi:osmotically-inducible protein OsmY